MRGLGSKCYFNIKIDEFNQGETENKAGEQKRAGFHRVCDAYYHC